MQDITKILVKATEVAAIATFPWVGKEDAKAADGAAVDAMRKSLNRAAFGGVVVIGEGAKDEAPELYTGEVLGMNSEIAWDIAVDPLEATDSVAYGRTHALSVIAAGPVGSILHAPDTYMEKLAVGPAAAKLIDLDVPIATNIARVAEALGKSISEINVMMLERPRHEKLVQDIRDAGAQVHLITDGDVAAMTVCMPDSGFDIYAGVGASAEAVLAAIPIKILGGEMLCRFAPKDESARQKIEEMCGAEALGKVYTAEDLAKGSDLIFAASGILSGPMLAGIERQEAGVTVYSMTLASSSQTPNYITSHYENEFK